MTGVPRRADVAVVGAGPVGLSLALGLARQGVRSVVLEKNSGTSDQSRAPGIHIRTREIFRQWRVEERLLEAGTLLPTVTLHRVAADTDTDASTDASPDTGRTLLAMDFRELDDEAEAPGLLVLEQGETESILLAAARETGMVDVRFGAEVVELGDGGGAVDLEIRDASGLHTLRAAFVVGCDGAGSFVRKALGLPFEGHTYWVRPVLADVDVADDRDAAPWPRVTNSPEGFTFALRLRPGRWRLVRLNRRDPPGASSDESTVPAAEVDDLVRVVLGPGPVTHVWASRFRIHRRSAPTFRVGRVLLAGDAAHIHSPAGGMGMNAGIQDAHNLAWKLASALRGGDVERLLESYDAERRLLVKGTVSRGPALVTRIVLQTPPGIRALVFGLWRTALRIRSVRRAAMRRASMLDLGYDESPLLERGTPSAGKRLPDPLLRLGGGLLPGPGVRLHSLLDEGPVILAVDEAGPLPADVPVGRVIRIGPGGYTDPTGLLCGLLRGGRDGGRGWILVRPDRHVGWTGQEPGRVASGVCRALGLGADIGSSTP